MAQDRTRFSALCLRLAWRPHGSGNERPFDQYAEVTTLSCASGTFCVAGDFRGYAYVLNPQG
jgi:hypothetical protein